MKFETKHAVLGGAILFYLLGPGGKSRRMRQIEIERLLRNGRMPDWNRMTLSQMRTFLRRRFHWNDTQIAEFVSSYQAAKLGQVPQAETINWDTANIVEMQAYLKKAYGLSDETSLTFIRNYLKSHPNRGGVVRAQGSSSGTFPDWLTWDIFSMNTLQAIPGVIADQIVEEGKRLVSPVGIAGVVAALVIGPGILVYWGVEAASASAVVMVAEYWIAARKASEIIERAQRSTGAFTAFFSGELTDILISGGPKGTLLRSIMGAMAAEGVSFEVESVLSKFESKRQ